MSPFREWARALAPLWIVGLSACHAGGPASPGDHGAMRLSLDGSRFEFVEASCDDGPLELGALGFERELRLAVGKGTLSLTVDSELATQGCVVTQLFMVTPAQESGMWRFTPTAFVAMPAQRKCGAVELEPTLGRLRSYGDMLEVVLQRSPWCRGFDARFLYRRVPWQRLQDRQLIRHYVAAWNAGDAAMLARLFVSTGSLIEPFSATDDGNYARHTGREALERWYAAALGAEPWSVLELRTIEAGAGEGQFVASWDYMDPGLVVPLRGRNLFVLAGGEIYESEIQLLDDPRAAPTTEPATMTAPSESSPSTGAANGENAR